ncbi:outer membrane beta-barrel protein [Ectothiorhodospiraceae bacterium 2226]|nr:outer membrane beta-barrel protein [Ectothiorhodospiraceae bacterium 2226]
MSQRYFGRAGACLLLAPWLAAAPSLAHALGQVDAGVLVNDYDSAVDSTTGWRVSGGYLIHDFVALELAYVALGQGDLRGKQTRYRVDGIAFGVRGYLPLTPDIFAVGHLGSFHYESRMHLLGQSHYSDGNGLYFGVGAEWSPAGPWYVGGDWRRYQVHGTHPQSFTLYVGARF